MAEIINPYTPGQPVDDPDLFFGRRDVLAGVRENLVKGRRVFAVSGPRRMGKTSLLRHLSLDLPEGFVPVRVELQEELPPAQAEERAPRLDELLWRLAGAIGDQVGRQLGVEGLEPAWVDFEGQTDRLLTQFWPQVRVLLESRCLVLMLDDLGSLAGEQANLLEPFLDLLVTWRHMDQELALVLTTSEAWQETLIRRYPRLFGGALTYLLGPLSSEEALRLITWPVDGVIIYDFGVSRRLIDITSGHPYYLQLLCQAVFDRCVTSGWVNQRDLDLVVEDLVAREIPEFRQAWDQSSPTEQAALAALVSQKGARGIATTQEVLAILTKAGARVDREQVEEALDALAARGYLERMGALSYRFRVALLRDWLAERTDLEQVVRDTRGMIAALAKPPPDRGVSRLRARRRWQKPPPRPEEEPGEVEDSEEEEGPGRSGAWLWIAVAAVLAVVLLVILGRALSLWGPAEPAPTAALAASSTVRLATATRTAVSEEATGPAAAALPTTTPLPEPTATPLLTPTPTPPLVVARPVPSIAYQSRGPGERRWSIYVMDSDGSNRTQLVDAQAEFLSAPSWSPDGARVAFVSDRDGAADIWVMDSDGSNPVNLTRHEAKDHSPAWSPDGEWIAFASVRDSLYWELYLMRADGSDLRRLTWWEDASDLWPTWSPDGTRLAFASKRDGNWEIYAMDRDGSNLLRLTDDPADDTHPAWSPEGSRIAFESTREGYAEIFVMPLVGGEPLNVSSLAWATDLGPTWSPDGGRIAFYSDRDGEWDIFVMASDGSNVVKLTGDNSSDQVPAWRP
jgi:hypothetical protein